MATLLRDIDLTNAVIEDRPLNKEEAALRRQKIIQQVASYFAIMDSSLSKLANDLFFQKNRPKLLFILLNAHIGNDSVRDRIIFMRDYIRLFIFFDKDLTQNDWSLLFEQVVQTEEKYQDKLLEKKREEQRKFTEKREQAILQSFPEILYWLNSLEQIKLKKDNWKQALLKSKSSFLDRDKIMQCQILAQVLVLRTIKLRTVFKDINIEEVSRPLIEAFNETHIRPIDAKMAGIPSTVDEALVQLYAAKLFAHLPEPDIEFAKRITGRIRDWFSRFTIRDKEYYDKLDKLDYGEYYAQILLDHTYGDLNMLANSFIRRGGGGWDLAINGFKVVRDILMVLNNEIALENTYFYEIIQVGLPFQRAKFIIGILGLLALPIIIAGATEVIAVGGMTVGLIDAGVAQVTLAVSTYGYSLGAASYIGICLQTFYLQHANTINELGLDAIEFIFDLPPGAGGRPALGSFQPGQEVKVAAKNAKGEAAVLKATVVSAEGNEIRMTVNVAADRPAMAVADRGIPQNPGPAVSPGDRGITAAVQDERTAAATAKDQGKAATDSKGLPDKAVNEDSRGLPKKDNPDASAQGKNGEAQEPQKGEDEKKSNEPGEGETPGKAMDAVMPKLNPHIDQNLVKKGFSEKALNRLDELGFDLRKGSPFTKQLQSSGNEFRNFVNDFHDNPGFKSVLDTWKGGKRGQDGARFAMKYANDLKIKRGGVASISFETGTGVLKHPYYEQMGGARVVDITVRDVLPSGETVDTFFELKSWTLDTLKRKKSELTAQLMRDTSILGPSNIRWVFDSEKLERDSAVKFMKAIIEKDPYLSKAWGGNAAAIRANLEKAVLQFP